MIQWQFWQTEADGQAWLDNPGALHAVVIFSDLEKAGNDSDRRITVVTREWLNNELARLADQSGTSTLVLPSMIVLRDAQGDDLRRLLDIALKSGGSLLQSLATPTGAGKLRTMG